MTAIYKMFGYMVKQITREMMMLMLVVAPTLMGVVFKFGIPLFERMVLSRYGMQEILVPYYEMISWLFAMVIGILFAFVGGLVVLGEIDEHVTRYIVITPVGVSGYLFSRILLPALFSMIISIVFIPLFSLCRIDVTTLAVMVIYNSLSGIVTALLVVSISSNKVEGMAIGKLSGLFGAAFFIPLLIKGNVKYVFCLLPMYHIGNWYEKGGMVNLVVSAVLFVGWIYVLYVRFRKKL